MRHRTGRGIGALVLVAAAGCAGGMSASGRTHAPAAARAAEPPVSSRELEPLLLARFGLAPLTLDVSGGRRVSIEFGHAPWSDSSTAIRFDRAYDVAQLVWERYGAALGIDTISVRRVVPFPGAAAGAPPMRSEEFFFYPAQLGARDHVRAQDAP